ncbi:MAG: DNA topoisomerase, partial [Desulfurococcaceae archaeon]
MKLILCEKPSVAREVAKAIGQASQKDGYIQAGDYYITWAYGHLLEIDDKIAPQKWDLESLPILPERFSYRPKDSNSQKQIKVIKELLNKVGEVIINTDAGREGELIARLILSFCGWKGKTLRLWTSLALTPEVVRKELRNLKPAEEFDSLYYSALARQHSDWIVGINLTRAVSLKANSGLWSVGRVQSPTLALIVQRDIQIENFKPEPYAIIKGIFEKGGQSYEGTLLYQAQGGDRPTDNSEEEEDDTGFRLSPEKAQEILAELKKYSQGYITKTVKERKREYPPNLFSLTSLQRHMNKTYGWKAQKTLDIAQSLYEKGYISYP